jgi:hypothetical protein
MKPRNLTPSANNSSLERRASEFLIASRALCGVVVVVVVLSS